QRVAGYDAAYAKACGNLFFRAEEVPRTQPACEQRVAYLRDDVGGEGVGPSSAKDALGDLASEDGGLGEHGLKMISLSQSRLKSRDAGMPAPPLAPGTRASARRSGRPFSRCRRTCRS